MNVMVVFNADDSDAAMVADHYRSARSLPAGHMCGVKGVDRSARAIDAIDFKEKIQKPLDACLAALPDPADVDYLVLVRGLPYRVNLPTYVASLEAVLQVHHTKVGGAGELAGAGQPTNTQPSVPNPEYLGGTERASDWKITNPYSSWYTAASRIVRATSLPRAFKRALAGSKGVYKFAGNLFIVSRLDGFDYKDANDLIDRAVASDGTMPTGELLCMRAEDDARGARDPECEFTTRMLAAAGFKGVWVDTFDGALSGHTLSAYFSGSADTIRGAIAGNTFRPGAITCNLTSVGAEPNNFFCSPDGTVCPDGEVQTSIARYVRAGATGAHGAVSEPLNNVFPNAGALLMYTFGYGLGESYFYDQRFLYWQNIYLGDPLATPYAERPKVKVPDAIGEGEPTTITATHPNGIASLTVYIAGKKVAASDAATPDTVVAHFEGALGAVGTKLDLLAVAVANNVGVKRTGWPNPDAHPNPDVQGWTAAPRTVVAHVPTDAGPTDAGTDANGATPPPAGGTSGGCACVVGSSEAPPAEVPLAGPVVALGLVFLGARRRAG